MPDILPTSATQSKAKQSIKGNEKEREKKLGSTEPWKIYMKLQKFGFGSFQLVRAIFLQRLFSVCRTHKRNDTNKTWFGQHSVASQLKIESIQMMREFKQFSCRIIFGWMSFVVHPENSRTKKCHSKCEFNLYVRDTFPSQLEWMPWGRYCICSYRIHLHQ